MQTFATQLPDHHAQCTSTKNLNRCVYCCVTFLRLGSSEVEQVQCVIDGIEMLIEMEKRLMAQQTIDDLIPAKKKN